MMACRWTQNLRIGHFFPKPSVQLAQSEHFVVDRPLTSMSCSLTISLLSLVWCCKSRQRIAILENARTLCSALGACDDHWSVKFNVNCEPALDVILVRAVTLTGSAKIRWATFNSEILDELLVTFNSQSHLCFIWAPDGHLLWQDQTSWYPEQCH